MIKFQTILWVCVLCIGCAALMTEQKYLRVETTVTKKYFIDAAGHEYPVYTIPEKHDIRKIRLLGKGKIINAKIYVLRKSRAVSMWKEVRRINQGANFPIDVRLNAYTDVVRVAGKIKGQIHTVEFYTFVQ